MNGLANIIASAGVLHGIAPEPLREEFATDQEFEAAWLAWRSKQWWTGSRIVS
jgi:hypothetical protein